MLFRNSVREMGMKLLTVSAVLNVAVFGDIVFNNEVFDPTQVFDLQYAMDSNVTSYMANQTKYYCIFRGHWDNATQPADYPVGLARFSNQAMFSHTKQYTPFLKDREAPFGVEKLAETGFTDSFHQEVVVAGELVDNYVEGDAFFVDLTPGSDKNHKFIPAINVSAQYNFLSGISAITPSPDWFTGFYLFDTIKTQQQTYWEHFLLRTYPWDSGTDNGQLYSDINEDTDPPGNIVRFTVANSPNKIFLNPAGDEVPYVAEWECIRHTCPIEDPGCEKEDWPPANGCDVLKYPLCATTCDPATESPCVKCADGSYHADCCQAGKEPTSGPSCDGTKSAEENSSAISTATTAAAILIVIGTTFLGLY